MDIIENYKINYRKMKWKRDIEPFGQCKLFSDLVVRGEYSISKETIRKHEDYPAKQEIV
jgi:hypothetical protein